MKHQPPAVSFFSFLILLTTAAVAAFALTYPLIGSIGPESGLLFGVVIGPMMYLSGAIRGAYRDRRGYSQDLIHELLVAAIALTLFTLVLTVNSIFVASCAPHRGIVPFLVHLVPVVVLDSACGLFVGRLAGRRSLAFFVALLLAVAHLFFLVVTWWQAPGFRFFSHPYLIVDGDLWNGLGFTTEVVAFKAVTIILCIAIIITGCVLFPSTNNSSFVAKAGSPYRVLLAAFACFVVGLVAHVVVAQKIQPSRALLRAELSRQTRRGTLIVHSDPTRTTLREAQAVLAEANLWRERLKSRLGKIAKSDIHIWLYPDPETLSHYTGAQNVHFALPRHREVHITGTTVPHPTLGHELAHVLLGEKTSTLLGVPGNFWILSNQGLTEGLAMMLTPELSVKNDLTLEEQAAALAQSGMLPEKDILFSLSPLSFFATNSSLAYSVAGAYLTELIQRSAKDVSQRRALIAKLANAGETTLTKHDDLIFQDFKTRRLPKDAIPSAISMFSLKPVLSSTCEDKAQNGDKLVSDPLVSARLALLKAKRMPDGQLQAKYKLLEEAGDLLWEAHLNSDAIATWKLIDLSLLPPQKQRPLQAKLLLAATDFKIGPNAIDYLMYATDPQRSVASTAVFAAAFESLGLNEDERNGSTEMALSNYLLLRAKVLATGRDPYLDLLKRLALVDVLPDIFKIESMRAYAIALALGQRASEASDAIEHLSQFPMRAALVLQLADIKERSQRISTALSLPKSDLRSADIWLLGTNRFDQ